MSRTLCALMAGAALVVVAPALAMAQDKPIPKLEDLSPERQRELGNLIELAEGALKRGEHKKALLYFEQAYEIFAHPRVSYRMAICYDKLGEVDRAITNYKAYITPFPDAPEAESIKTRLSELEQIKTRKVAQIKADSTSLRVSSKPPGATVYLHDKIRGAAGTTPTADLPLEPGKIRIILERDGYEPSVNDVEVKPGENAEHVFTLIKKAPDPNAEQPGKTRSRGSATPWVFAGVGALATGAAVTFFVMHDPNLERGQDVSEDDFKRNQNYETAAYGSGAVALLAFSGAVIFWITEDSSGPKKGALEGPQGRALTPSVWAAPGAGGLSVMGRF